MTALQRSLGLPMLTFYGTGMILGAGIYSVIGKAAGRSGESLWLSFLLAAVAALLTGLSYAELSTMFPKAGAEYVYLSQAFKKRKWIGSTIGLAMAFSGSATAATVALAFSGYLGEFVKIPAGVTAAAVLLLFSGLSVFGIRASGWANILFTLIEVSGLLLIIYLGISSEKFAATLSVFPHWGTLSGAALVVFSFFGFENIVNLAEEAKSPEKDLPRAIFISLTVSTTLYVLVALAALALLSVEKLAASDAALMTVARTASPLAGNILGGIALFSTANTALISLVGASRVIYGMAKAKALPKAAAAVVPSRKTPWIASLLVLGAALLLLPFGKIETVAAISSFATMATFLAVNIAVISLRYTEAKRKRPFVIPLALGKLPLPALLGALLSLVFLTQFEPMVYVVGIAFLAVAAAVFIAREN